MWKTGQTGPAITTASGAQLSELFSNDINVVENNGTRQLGVNGDGAYQINNGGRHSCHPEGRHYPGWSATFAGWAALQAEATDAGFAVLWQDPNGGYAVWQTDAAGSYVSSYSLQASELIGLETCLRRI